MLALAFLHPMLLWALPLAAVPIVIHILNRRRYHRVPWAAMEFLLRAMKRNRKRLRMEQWLVLLLRVLAVLLLVSLVSRPQLGGGGLLGSITHHVVVIDDSASMAQRSGSVDLFAKAQDRVRQLADELGSKRSGDLFSVVRTSQPEHPDLWAAPIGGDFGHRVGTLLKELPGSDLPCDLGKALQRTVQRGREAGQASRTEFYVVGDRRSWDWATADDRPRPALLAALLDLDAEREHLTVIGVGGQHQNLGVVDVRVVDRLAVAGVPVALAIDVQNFGLDPTPPTSVAIEVDGQSRVVQAVPQLAPGERVAVPAGHTFHQAGPHRVDVQLDPSEQLPRDDRRTLALDVRDKSRVLLVDGQPDEDDGEVFFVQATLDLPDSGIESQVVSEVGLDEANLDAFDLVWLCNVQAPTAAVARRIEEFVAGGGGLVVTCGALVDAARYDELWWRGGEGPLPLPIGEIAGDPDRPERAVLTDPDHPVCDQVGELFQLLLGNVVQVKRWLTFDEPVGHQAKIVARIRGADGPPLLVSRTFGAGEVIALSVTSDRFWSNLPSTDLFLVLTHQLQRSAARRIDTSGQNLQTDGEYRRVLDAGIYRPDAAVRSAAADDERTVTALVPPPTAGDAAPNAATPASPVMVLPMRELRALGAYELELQRHDGNPEKLLIARNLPSDESRTVGYSEAAFQRQYPQGVHDRVTFVRDDVNGGAATGEGEAWQLLAALLLIGLLTESLLAWRFGRR